MFFSNIKNMIGILGRLLEFFSYSWIWRLVGDIGCWKSYSWEFLRRGKSELKRVQSREHRSISGPVQLKSPSISCWSKQQTTWLQASKENQQNPLNHLPHLPNQSLWWNSLIPICSSLLLQLHQCSRHELKRVQCRKRQEGLMIQSFSAWVNSWVTGNHPFSSSFFGFLLSSFPLSGLLCWSRWFFCFSFSVAYLNMFFWFFLEGLADAFSDSLIRPFFCGIDVGVGGWATWKDWEGHV